MQQTSRGAPATLTQRDFVPLLDATENRIPYGRANCSCLSQTRSGGAVIVAYLDADHLVEVRLARQAEAAGRSYRRLVTTRGDGSVRPLIWPDGGRA